MTAITRGILFVTGILTTTLAGAQTQDDFGYRMESATVVTGQSVDVRLLADTNFDLAGWSTGVCHDPSRLTLVYAAAGEGTLTARCGSSPDFLVVTEHGDGWTTGVVVSKLGNCNLEPGTDHELFVSGYEGGPTEGPAELEFCDTLGLPPVPNVVVVNGAGYSPVLENGVIEVLETAPFTRGDCDQDGVMSIVDAIFEANYLFLSGPEPGCEDACDADDSGSLGLPDPIRIVSAIFSGAPAPPAPFGTCGADPTLDLLDCEDLGVRP